MGEWTVCSPGSTAGGGAALSVAAEAATGAAGKAEISGTAAGVVCTAKWVTGAGGATTCSTPRLMRTFTSPRSNSNSAISFSIKNSMSSFSSFWFIVCGGTVSFVPRARVAGDCRRMSPMPSLRVAASKRNRCLGSRGQNLAASLRDHHHVFYPHSKLAWDIYAGFDGDHHPRAQQFCLSGRYAWWFMNFQSHPVAGRMRKITVQVILFQ